MMRRFVGTAADHVFGHSANLSSNTDPKDKTDTQTKLIIHLQTKIVIVISIYHESGIIAML